MLRNRKRKNGWAVVTGASSGIGAEFARALAKEGYPLVLVARRKLQLEKLVRELEGHYHTECRIIIADLGKETECRRLTAEIAEKTVAVFINNAGFGDCGSFLDTDLDKELSMIDVNVRAVHLLTKLILTKMQRQGGGYLLNVASAAGLMPAGPFMATYYATKAYVASMTRAVAEELREKESPVYIGCLCPGPVDTEFNQTANVQFALRGITAKRCVRYALRKMKCRRIVIVPTLTLKLAMTFGRFLPQPIYIQIAAHQQKKKI